MPHLCDKMRRLTAKDIAKRKEMEDEPAPDFYAFSRQHPVPEGTSSSSVHNQASPLVRATSPQNAAAAAELELALLERHRAAMLERLAAFPNGAFLQQGFAPLGLGSGMSLLGGGLSTGYPQGNIDIAKLLALQQHHQQQQGNAGANAGMLNRFGL